MVLGMNQATYARIEPWITVYSGRSDVNFNESSMQLLQVINDSLQRNHIQNAALQKRLSGDVGGGAGNNGQANTQNAQFDTANPASATPGNDDKVYSIQVEARTADAAHAGMLEVVKLQSANIGMTTEQVFDWKQQQLPEALFSEAAESRLITVQDELRLFN